VIDVHVHLHPPRLFAAIRRWFAERSPWQLDHPTDPAAVAATLRAAGVRRFVFCSYAHKPGMARELNAWLAATARDLGGYGVPLATVHLDDPDPLADLRTAFGDGCIGLKVHEDVQQLALDDARFDPLYAEIAAQQGFVLAHIGPVPWRSDTNDGPARVARVLARHPQLRVVVAHFGVPDSPRYVQAMRAHPNLFLDTTMAFAAGSPMFAGADRALVEAGASNIVLGTDYPNTPYPYEADRRGLEALGLSAATLREILSENACRLAPVLADEPRGG
jgi:predicted TIM-barrel fold metal-dependent hydrolase